MLCPAMMRMWLITLQMAHWPLHLLHLLQEAMHASKELGILLHKLMSRIFFGNMSDFLGWRPVQQCLVTLLIFQEMLMVVD